MTRIGLISEMYGGTTPPTGYGGISATIYDLVCEFVRRGHDVTLFATPGSWANGARVIICKPEDHPLSVNAPLPAYAVEALKHLDEIDVWVDGSHHKWFARECKQRYKDVNVLCPSWNPNKDDLPQNSVLQSPALIDAIGNMPKNTPWFYAGIPLDEYEPCYEVGERGVSINVMAVYKGVDILVRSAAKHKFPLDLYGHAPNEKWLQQAILPYVDKCDNIVYHGPCGPERKQHLAKASAFFLIATWWEPGSRATLEAFACGCPPVMTRAGSLKHYIEDTDSGAYVKANEDSVYEGYLHVLEGGPDMRHRARQVAEDKFSLVKYADNWERMFARVMKGERWE